tara:strand:+ start:3995 stop:5110 length:1116 start_codon:yes stop_codon:yes gene_type:complete
MIKTVDKTKVPWWVSNIIVPLVNLTLAFLVSGLFIFIAGENPYKAMKLILYGSFGYIEGFGYTLYYATNFIFTGLAFAIAFHCRLFNIGGEGQAYIGGLGVFLVAYYCTGLPIAIVWLLAILGSIIFGGAWAVIPGYLQAYRGSHVVITTIMFNFIASALMVFLLVDVIRDTNQMGPHTVPLDKEQWFPMFRDIAGWFGMKVGYSPLNITFILSVIASFAVWFLIWRTKWGYEMRAVGHNTQAAIYAGISPKKNIILAMVLSGALAGMLGVNEILGVHHKIMVNFPAGYGFTGIAVALMGRNHPIGIFLAAILFGMLYQGGSEVTFDMPNITRYMFVAVQGVIILFSGALENLFRPQIEYFFVNQLKEKKV